MSSIYRKRALISTITLILLCIITAATLPLRCYARTGQPQGITPATGQKSNLVTPQNTRQRNNYQVTVDAQTEQTDNIAVGGGKVIVISIPRQWMYIYGNGKQIASTAITTGRPGLDTPIGTFHIFNKQSPTTFYSRWPAGSPNYFPPSHVNYAMEFAGGGYFIHDSSWRYEYGPGTDEQHYIPGHGYETGTHGCVNVPLSTMTWLYRWAPIGTTVQVTN